jgi:hypothetical protein
MAKDKEKATTAMVSFQFVMPREDDPQVWESEDLYRKAQKVVIKTDKGMSQVNEMLVRVKELLKDAKEKRELIVKPIKEQLLNPVDAFFKKITDPLIKAEKMFKIAIAERMLAKDRESAELAEMLKDADKGGTLSVEFAPETRIESSGGSKTVATPVWTFTIDDVDKVPVEYLRSAVRTTRGEEALNQIIRALVSGGTRKIPGVTIKEGKQISVTLR